MVVDAVGYSKHMEANEDATLASYKECEAILKDLLKKHDGSIFNTAGDSVLSEFSSAVNAVECGVEFQRAIKEKNSKQDNKVNIEFRVGINMGDVVETDGNLLGDGVNIAARLEALSMPGGVSISKSVHDMIVGKTKLTFKNQGLQKVKQNEFYVYDVVIDPTQTRTLKAKGSTTKNNVFLSAIGVGALALAFVLFQNVFESNNVGDDFQRIAILSLDPGSDNQSVINLASGLTEDLSTSLTSASKKLTVVTLNEAPSEIENLYSEINARYLIDGSIRQSGSNIRISINLTDTKTSTKVWSEKYDKSFTVSNVFSLQDEIVDNVIDALIGNGAVLAQEVAKNFTKTGTEKLSAYECVNFVRGQYFKNLSPEMHSQGLSCLRKAVIDDPEYKEAWALLAHMVAWGYSLYVPYFQAVEKSGLVEAFNAIDNAIRIDKNYARAFATKAELYFYENEWDQMMVNAEKAFELSPGDVYNVGHLGYVVALSGLGCDEPEKIKIELNVDDKACDRLEWGYRVSLLANDLDAVSTLTFENYGLLAYYSSKKNHQKLLESMEQVPTPSFHWWNFWMGNANYYLGNKDRAKQFFKAVSDSYGGEDKALQMFKIAANMWNIDKILHRWSHLSEEYGWK